MLGGRTMKSARLFARVNRLATVGLFLVVLILPNGIGTADAATTPVQYHGGAVMASAKIYTIFWIPQLAKNQYTHFESSPSAVAPQSPGDLSFENHIDQFLTDLNGSSAYNILTQYSAPGGHMIQNQSTFGGSFVDSVTPYPHSGSEGNPLIEGAYPGSQGDFLDEIKRVLQMPQIIANHWAAGPNSLFLIFTGFDIHYCSDTSKSPGFCTFRNGAHAAQSVFCGNHQFDSASGIIYAPLADGATLSNNPCPITAVARHLDPIADAEISWTSHELFESVTDPHPFNGWLDASDGEIGDKCEPPGVAIPVDADQNNVTLANNHRYLIQPEWSNVDGACVLGYSGFTAFLSANQTRVSPGTAITLTSQITRALTSDTSVRTVQIDQNGNSVATLDTVCSPTEFCTATDSSANSGSKTYVAQVTSTEGALLAQSSPVTVSWQPSNILVNGSFEQGPDLGPSGGVLSLNPGDTSITGWTVTQAQIDYVSSQFWQASDGARSLDLDGTPGNGGIQQTIATTPGTTYAVSFDMAGNPGGLPTVKTMAVRAAGQSATFSFDTTGTSFANMGWVTHTWSFVANSTSTTLEFDSADADGGAYGATLDNVSVVSTSNILPYNSSGYTYQVVSFNQGTGFEQPAFDDSSWSSGVAAFGQAGYIYGCPLDSSARTNWTLNTDLLVRHHFTVPVNVTTLKVGVAVDNYAQVFINGHDISNGLQPNPFGCAISDGGVYSVPAADLVSGDNVLAVRARDVGGDDYLDVRIFTDE
jgi:choice-of-anchor C domain-containing protein